MTKINNIVTQNRYSGGMSTNRKSLTSNLGGKREGAGRPAFLEEPKTFYVRVDGSTAYQLESIANTNERKVSEILREAIDKYLQNSISEKS